MSAKYEKLYAQTPDALGAPFAEVVDWFAAQDAPVDVLDIGAGQGRDALFLGRAGHRVTALDLSPSGLCQLQDAADREALNISTQVVDLVDYTPDRTFDVILADRTLHMLPEEPRLALVARLITCAGRAFLIADEKSNLGAIEACFDASVWSVDFRKAGFLFLTR